MSLRPSLHLVAAGAAAALAGCGQRAPNPSAPALAAPPPSASAGAPAASGFPAAEGAWRVVRVEAPTTGVQALAADDPAYIGAILDVSARRLAWRPHGAAELSDVCEGPRLEAGAIRCASGVFGPDGSKAAVSPGSLRFDWYDNARLTLVPARDAQVAGAPLPQ